VFCVFVAKTYAQREKSWIMYAKRLVIPFPYNKEKSYSRNFKLVVKSKWLFDKVAIQMCRQHCRNSLQKGIFVFQDLFNILPINQIENA
jgi:hypothetical protein